MKKVFIIFLIAVVVYLLSQKWYPFQQSNHTQNSQIVSPVNSINQQQTLFHFLLLGYGGGEHQGGKLTDTIILLRVDTQAKTITIVNLPRDLWVEIPLSFPPFKSKINAAYAFGEDKNQYKNRNQIFKSNFSGLQVVQSIVEEIIHHKIDASLVFNFSSFVGAIDSLGGVKIDIPYTFTDKLYPIEGQEQNTCDKTADEIKSLSATMSADLLMSQFPCRFEELHFEKGKTILDGNQALKYLRSRKGDVGGNDFGRSKRLEILLLAIRTQLFSPSQISKTPLLIAKIIKGSQTNQDLKSWLGFYSKLGTIEDYQISSKQITLDNVLRESRSKDKQYILIPRQGEFEYSAIREFVVK